MNRTRIADYDEMGPSAEQPEISASNLSREGRDTHLLFNIDDLTLDNTACFNGSTAEHLIQPVVPKGAREWG